MKNTITRLVSHASESGQPESMKVNDIFVIKNTKYICVHAGKNWLGDPMLKLRRLEDCK